MKGFNSPLRSTPFLVFLLLLVLSSASSTSSSSTSTSTLARKVVVGVDGGTESIRACCFDAETGRVVGKSCAVPYKTTHPQPGWAEQNPLDWWTNLGAAVRGALASTSTTGETIQVCAMCVDTTCCSVVALDDSMSPLRPSLLWMDARSAPQTRHIFETCQGDPCLDINSGGEGPLSAEWMLPKALWIYENEKETVWTKAKVICEYQDYINFKLTGVLCASSCNAAARWHWNGQTCLQDASDDNKYPGRPMSLYQTLGIPELADKLPQKCLAMGSLVGSLTQEAAHHLGLPTGVPVAQGGPDAFVGMIGLGCIYPGQLCLITGSSHLHCVVTSEPKTAPGTWGAYPGAPLPHINFAEGGQSSTGSIARWAKLLFSGNANEELEYKMLDEEAEEVAPGSDGLVALETFQGSRTPVTDPLARGALVGLTLSHGRSHIWRALLEAVCFGTRACVEGLAEAGHGCDEIVIAGGATRSPLWLQMHADVTGKPVVVCENADAPLLGCAILASVGAGIHPTAEAAVQSMVRTAKRIEPNPAIVETYSNLYNGVYSKLSSAVRPVVHSISQLRGGGSIETLDCSLSHTTPLADFHVRGGAEPYQDVSAITEEKGEQVYPIVSPSLLASDWSNIESEIERCVKAGLPHLHIDVFDGVFLDSPYALTFGPQMIEAMRRCSNRHTCKIVLDIHLCVDRPARYVEAMAKAGADRIIFQWEAMTKEANNNNDTTDNTIGQLEQAVELAKAIREHGMLCGISINPQTGVEEILPLLERGLVDLVDILAVEPGFGGQSFQESVLVKIHQLRRWIDTKGGDQSDQVDIQLLVDGGINAETSSLVIEAGADILVAGTFLFQHPSSISDGAKELLSKKE